MRIMQLFSPNGKKKWVPFEVSSMETQKKLSLEDRVLTMVAVGSLGIALGGVVAVESISSAIDAKYDSYFHAIDAKIAIQEALVPQYPGVLRTISPQSQQLSTLRQKREELYTTYTSEKKSTLLPFAIAGLLALPVFGATVSGIGCRYNNTH